MTVGRRKAPRTQATLSKSVDRCLLEAPGKPALELEAGNRRSQAKGALDVVDCKPIRGWDPQPLTGTVDSRAPAFAAAARQSMPPRPCSKGSFGRCSAKAAKLPPLAIWGRPNIPIPRPRPLLHPSVRTVLGAASCHCHLSLNRSFRSNNSHCFPSRFFTTHDVHPFPFGQFPPPRSALPCPRDSVRLTRGLLQRLRVSPGRSHHAADRHLLVLPRRANTPYVEGTPSGFRNLDRSSDTLVKEPLTSS